MVNLHYPKRKSLLIFIVIIFVIIATVLIVFVFQSSESQPEQTSTQTKSLDASHYVLKNVIAENLRECSVDLVGLEEYPAIQNLSVLRSLCIQYTDSNPTLFGKDPFSAIAAGTYNAGTIAIYTNDGTNKTISQKRRTLLHELCHANQHYYMRFKAQESHWMLTPLDWNKTPAGQEFIDIIGYGRINNQWSISRTSPFARIYHIGPKKIFSDSQELAPIPMELAAEVCSIFLSTEVYKDKYTQAQMDNVLNNQELREWFNKYVSGIAMLPTQDIHTMYYSDGSVKEKRFYRANEIIERIEKYRQDGLLQEKIYYAENNYPRITETYRLDGITLWFRNTYSTTEEWRLEQYESYNEDGTLELRTYYNPDGTIEREER